MRYEDFDKYVENNKNTFDYHIAKHTKLPTGENDCIVEFKDPKTTDGAMVFMFGAQPAIKTKATAKPAA